MLCKQNESLKLDNLLKLLRSDFIKSTRSIEGGLNEQISSSDALLSSFSLFHQKHSSLLSFEDYVSNEMLSHNLKKLYLIDKIPSDSRMREKLDDFPITILRGSFKLMFSLLQRNNYLKRYQYYDGHYLLSLDGTGYFESNKIHCDNCCEKTHRNGKKSYYHHMLCGSLVHPDCKEVIPFIPEPICKSDGYKKNDCERNASGRFLSDFRREHPHLKTIVIADALSSNGPFLDMLQEEDLRYIIGIKPKGNKFLFSWVEHAGYKIWEYKDDNGVIHRFKYSNDMPLNYDCFDKHKVNFIEYYEISPNGKEQRFSWITDIEITESNLMQLMRGGRARWKIENETFNTLKNQGYHFEHNFGHGYKNLSNIFACMMMLAFFVDQITAMSCKLFQQTKQLIGAKTRVWSAVRSAFESYFLTSWESLYTALATKNRRALLDSS